MEVFQSGGETKFQLVEIARKKGELTLVQSVFYDDLSTAVQNSKPALPLFLVYNTASVITKSTAVGSTLENRAAVENLFPGLNFDNFYYQIARLKNTSFISVCKQTELDNLIQKLKELKINLVGISLGPSSLSSILGYLKEDLIYTHTDKITLTDAQDTSISISKTSESVPTRYHLNGLEVTNADMLSFGGVVHFLTADKEVDSNYGDMVETLKSSFVTNRTFTLLLRMGILLVLGILLVNFLVFNHYFEATERIRTNLALDSENKKNLTLLRDRVEEKEKKVDAILSFSNSKASFYLDRLAASIPQSILLTALQYQPLSVPIQAAKPIVLQGNTILVLGSSANSEDFSTWITQLETMDWVDKVETMDYDYRNNTSSEFKVHINIAAPQE